VQQTGEAQETFEVIDYIVGGCPDYLSAWAEGAQQCKLAEFMIV
jgi:hypothetical protein